MAQVCAPLVQSPADVVTRAVVGAPGTARFVAIPLTRIAFPSVLLLNFRFKDAIMDPSTEYLHDQKVGAAAPTCLVNPFGVVIGIGFFC